MIEVCVFEDEVQELKTLPRASVEIDGLLFQVRVCPQDYLGGYKNVAVVLSEQSPAAKTYLDGVLDSHQSQYDQTAPPGILMEVERRYILRSIPESRLTYV
jgi:hypothetical protein